MASDSSKVVEMTSGGSYLERVADGEDVLEDDEVPTDWQNSEQPRDTEQRT